MSNETQQMNDTLALSVAGGATIVRIENETQQALMMQRPRDIDKVIAAALHELEIAPVFALSVFYSIPYKDRSNGEERTVDVEGTGTHGAAMLARLWTNNSHGVRVTGETERHIHLEGVFMDYESNTRTVRPFIVNKFAYRHSTKSEVPLSARDIQIAIQAGVSKADRNAIMSSLPPALKVAFFNKARMIALTLATPERINALLATCDEHKVGRGKVMAFIGAKSADAIKGPAFVRLAALANALSEGEATAADIGGEKREKSSKSAVAGLAAQQPAAGAPKQAGNRATITPEAPKPAAAPSAPAPAGPSVYDTLMAELAALKTADDITAWGKAAGARMATLSNDELEFMRLTYVMALGKGDKKKPKK
jgi:hypothetical protein